MKPTPSNLVRYQVIFVQSLVALSLLLLSVLWVSSTILFSLGWGAFAAWLPSVIFAWYALQFSGARNIKKIVKRFYFAEIVKLISAIGLLYIGMSYLKLTPIALLIGFFYMHLASWVVVILFNRPLRVTNLE